MKDASRMTDELLQRPMFRGLTRRSLLRTGLAGIATVGTGGLLAACGGDDDDADDDDSGSSSSASPTEAPSDSDSQSDEPTTTNSESSSGEPKSGGSITVGMNREPDSMDQHVGSSRYNEFINMNIYDRLIERGDDMGFFPGIAESWEVSDDGMVWTLVFRDGVVFHDGTAFDANVMKHNFDRISDPETKSQKAVGLLGPYASSEVIDDLTLEVLMSDLYPGFIDALAALYLVPESPTAIDESGADYGQQPVGTGPFKFNEWIPSDHLTISRYDEYDWGPSVFAHTGAAYLDEIRFQFIPEDSTRVTTLETGETDAIINLPPQDFGRFDSSDDYYTIVSPVLGQPPGIIVNTERPPTDDINVRLALEHGIDQDALIETVFYGVFDRAYGPLTQFNDFYDPAVEDFYGYDPEMAKQILEDAGWQEGGDGIREKDGNKLAVEFISFSGGVSIKVAEFVQAQLREIGFDVSIRQLDNPANLTASQAGEHNLRWLNWLFSDAAELATTFHSRNIGNGWNFSRFQSDELDGLLDEAKVETDAVAREDLYSQIQLLIMENALIVPLYVGSQVIAARKELQGIRMHPLGDNALFYDAFLGE